MNSMNSVDEARTALRNAVNFEQFDAAVTDIERQAGEGNPAAIEFVAMFEAVGAGRDRNFDRSLAALVRAAQRGSQSALSQLRILAREEGDDPEKLRDRIDMAALIAAPAAETLCARPTVRAFRQFATPQECAFIIGRQAERLEPAKVWDRATGKAVSDPVRDNMSVELRISEMDVVTAIVRARIAAATRLPEHIFEVPQFMRYEVGQQFRPHFDFLDPADAGMRQDLAQRGQRIGTFLVMLNDDYEGGATHFPKAGLRFRGKTGDALLFSNALKGGAPDPASLHAGEPPTKGEKFIISQWIRAHAPRG